jgi:hypothetical protein
MPQSTRYEMETDRFPRIDHSKPIGFHGQARESTHRGADDRSER